MFVGLGLCHGKKPIDCLHIIRMTACGYGFAKRQERRPCAAQCLYRGSAGRTWDFPCRLRTVRPEKSSRCLTPDANLC